MTYISKKVLVVFSCVVFMLLLIWGGLYFMGIELPILKMILGVGFITSGFLFIYVVVHQTQINGILRIIMIIKPGISFICAGGFYIAWYFSSEIGMMIFGLGVIMCVFAMVVLLGRYKRQTKINITQ